MPADSRRKEQAKQRQGLALVEAPGGDHTTDRTPSDGDCSPLMAVSIAGVSTACSKDALASSAKAVRKTLTPE
jgi:hypothetical protein